MSDASSHRSGRPRARRFTRRSSPSAVELTERDYHVLAALADHRVLSADHLWRLVFRGAASKVRRRLRSLYDHRLIDRLRLVAIPTQGIPPFLYTLTAEGAATLRFHDATRVTHRGRSAGLQFQHHRHLINELYVTLMEAARAQRCSIANWRHEEQLRLPAANGLPGKAERVPHPTLGDLPLLPDAYFELEVPGGGRFAYFVEVDRATHPHRVWRDRAHLYSTYADPHRGLFRRRFGRETFRLLIVTTNDFRRRSRRDNILHTIRETIGPSDLFLAATFADVKPDRLLRPIWHRADGGNPCSIARNPPLVVRASRS